MPCCISGWLQTGSLYGFLATERFYEIGTPTGLAETEAFLIATRRIAASRGRASAAARLVYLPFCPVPSSEQMQTVEVERARERGVLRWRDGADLCLGRGPVWAELRGQGFRFALVGGGRVRHLRGDDYLLAEVIGLPFEVSLAIGFALAIATHFNLQRLYVWRHAAAFALPLHHQLARYLTMAGIQYGLTAAITSTVPHALGISPELVYLPTVTVITATNFLIFRSRIFHAAIDTLHE